MFPMVGQISLFAFNFAPQHWLKCDGTLLPISEYETLFQLLGFKFGGNNEDAFSLPNLTSTPPTNLHYCMASAGEFQPRTYNGYVGETMLTAFKPEATNLLPANGQSVSKSKYAVLDMLMGTRFGGDGQNLALPNLQAPRDCQYVIAVTGDPPPELNPSARKPFVGEIRFLPYQQPSESLMICDGTQLQIDQHPMLYALIGSAFGGGGKTFALPDLTKVAPKGYSYYLVNAGVVPPRS